MSDYQKFLGFLGTPLQSEELLKPFQAFETQAKSVQQKLGTKSHLLYRFIEKMFSIQTHRYFYEATDDGFEACADTLRFCNIITKGKPVSAEDSELRTIAAEYYENDLKKYQNQSTRSALLHLHVFHSYIEHASAAYHENFAQGLDRSKDCHLLLEYYDDMKNELGGEAALNGLQECLQKAFFPISFMQAHTQSAVNALADHLIMRDDETSKTIIQLFLEA